MASQRKRTRSMRTWLMAFLVCALLHPVIAAEPERPNIVLILADDLGINDLGCYGRKEHTTPQLDLLAKDGLRFTCAYTAQPICSPSRAALMTGKCPARLHLTNYLPGRPDAPSQKLLNVVMEGQLPVEEVTLAELLKRHGYATGLFGKWHLGGKGFGPKEQGFDVAFEPPTDSEPSATEGGKNEYAITQAAMTFIEEHQEAPFFCYVPHHCPHIRLHGKPELIAKHQRTFNPANAALLETLDDAVGLLLKKLDELDLAKKTIVIFTSDNGGLHVLESPDSPATHNTPYRAGKGYVYEGGLRVPLIVRWPDQVRAGSVSDAPVVLTDLVPTLLHAAGIDPAKTVGPLDGVNLLPLLKGERLPPQPLFWHFPHYTNQGSRPAGAIRDGDWKLIEHLEDGTWELFNLAEDAGETKNLAETSPQHGIPLLSKLHAWRKSVGAQLPAPNPEFDAALHRRLYVDQDPSQLKAGETASVTAIAWKEWRVAMNSAIKDRQPKITPATGDIRLHAKDARIHAKTMRYEPEPHKNVLGYWVNPADWADWEFDVPAAGRYEVEIQQGCGAGCGGSEVHVEIGDTKLAFIVQETGHFQHMILRNIGTVELPKGKSTLAIKPQTKPGPAVMDVRRVVLRPVP
ncbi:MAG: sulfatase [Planctomycetaceae bacterium]|nr:sulfatase [Planctomycetaceae bacterium]